MGDQATLADVATLAGVSLATASRALSPTKGAGGRVGTAGPGPGRGRRAQLRAERPRAGHAQSPAAASG